ncbi:hypothetical protein BC832DRAFT_547898 [Gaertneriomyces semiglobifer]|nr:hypothetical protein BC832DRAFT_547898 [Gaertneriomyces semiglobifer]
MDAHNGELDSLVAEALPTSEEPEFPEGLRRRENTSVQDEVPEEAETPLADPPQAAGRDDRICRICFGGQEDEPELGRLLSPCKCNGTMKYVHVECLNEWRRNSRKKESFYQCDQCLYRYNFARTTWARIAVNEVVVTLLTFAVFLVSAIFSGFGAKLILMYYGPGSIFDWELLEDLELTYFANPAAYSMWRIDIVHLLLGVMLLGVMGFTQLAATVFWGTGIPGFRTRRMGGGRDGSLIFTVIIVIGVVKMVWAMYKGVREWSRRRLEVVEAAIMDVRE